jgi:hypothetical protein
VRDTSPYSAKSDACQGVAAPSLKPQASNRLKHKPKPADGERQHKLKHKPSQLDI